MNEFPEDIHPEDIHPEDIYPEDIYPEDIYPEDIYPEDIYTEPKYVDVDTLKNLGPFTGMAGIWEGFRGLDVKPKAEGPKKQVFVEHIELQPIDPQTNGPQLFYGLRYYTHVVKPDQVKTYHARSVTGCGNRQPAR